MSGSKDIIADTMIRHRILTEISPDYSSIDLGNLDICLVRKLVSDYFTVTDQLDNNEKLLDMTLDDIATQQKMIQLIDDPDSESIARIQGFIDRWGQDSEIYQNNRSNLVMQAYEDYCRLTATLDQIFINPNSLAKKTLEDILGCYRLLYNGYSERLGGIKFKLQYTIDFLKREGYLDAEFRLDSIQFFEAQKELQILPDFYKVEELFKIGDFVAPQPGDSPYSQEEILSITANPKLIKVRQEAMKRLNSGIAVGTHPADLVDDHLSLPNSEIWNHYWGIHSQVYRNRIDRLANQVEGNRGRFRGKKAIVAIASMNEPNLDQALAAIASSYGEDFEREVTVLIYNNYKETTVVSAAAQNALSSVQARQNVVVVNEEVPQYNNTGMAKKTVSDLAMTLMGEEMDTALIMMDGDVRGLSEHYIQDSIAAIDNPLYKAASPEFDYSQEDLAQYPVLRRLFELRYKFAIEDISRALPGGRHITYGMCYTITPRILAAIGGLKPQKQYEDTQVTNDLKELLLYSVSDSANNPYYRVNPVAPLNVTDGHVVYVGVDREISDIRRGRGPFTRWTNSSYHVEVTARDRDDIRVGEQQFAELGVLNEDNMAVALNNSDPFLFRQVDIMSSRSSSTFEYFHRFYRFLKREGIEIIDADIVVMDSAKQENLAAGQYLEKYGETGEYNIKRIKKVRFTKTQHP